MLLSVRWDGLFGCFSYLGQTYKTKPKPKP
jgi:hypothetical protein